MPNVFSLIKEENTPLLEIGYNDENIYIYNKKNKKKYSISSFDLIQQQTCPKCGKNIHIYKCKSINQKKLELECDCSNNKENEIPSPIEFICLEHKSKYEYYCFHCEKNLCQKCYKFHKNHEIINLNKILINQNEYIENINKIEKKILEMDSILNDFNKENNNINISFRNKIKEFKKIVEISKMVFLIYCRQLQSKELKYEIIQNVYNLSNFNNINFNLKKDEKNNYLKLNEISKFIKDFRILRETTEKKYQKPISQRECFVLKDHKDVIQCLLLLHDERLASASNDGSIIIYNNHLQKNFTINIHDREVYNIIENKSNDIISCSADRKICVIQLFNNTYLVKQVIKSHYDQVIHIREFSNLNLYSTSLDKSIKIWGKKKSSYQLITTLKTKDKIYSILELKNNKEFVCLEGEKNVVFYDIFNLTQKNEFTLRDVKISGWTNAICLIDENLLAIGGLNKIILYNISIHEISKTIYTESQIICIKKLGDNIFCGDVSGNLSQWKLNKEDLVLFDEKKKAHQNKIATIVQFENGIVSGSNDCNIKIWE